MGFRSQFALPAGIVRMDNANAGTDLDIDLGGNFNIDAEDSNIIIAKDSQLDGTLLYLRGLEMTSLVGIAGTAAAIPGNPVGYYYLGGKLVPFWNPPTTQPLPMDRAVLRSTTVVHDTVVNNITVQQCPGISVGDILVLAVSRGDNNPPSAVPAGFANLYSLQADATKRLDVYTKTVTAADVATDTYTVGNATAVHCVVFLAAVTRHNGIEFHTGAATAAGMPILDLAGFDPVLAGDLILTIRVGQSLGAGGPSTINNNPNWITHEIDTAWWVNHLWAGTYKADTPTGNMRMSSPGGATYNVVWLAFAPAP